MNGIARKVFFFILAGAVLSRAFGSAPEQNPLREVRVKVLGDEEWRDRSDWRKASSDVLALVSAEFERLFGIRFTAEDFQAWAPDGRAHSLDALAEDLDSKVEKGSTDIVLAITARTNLNTGYAGYSLFKEGLVLVRSTPDAAELVRTLIHEFGHLFGAVHIDDPGSVMDKFIQGRSFDNVNAQLIALNRGRSFRTVEFPIPKALRPKVLPLYEKICDAIRFSRAHKKNESNIGAGLKLAGEDQSEMNWPELDDAFGLLAQIHLENKDYEKTLSACREALSINPRNLETQNLMAIALRRMGRVDEAIDKYISLLVQKPRLARVRYNLGIACAKKGDLDAALASYKTALAIKPNFVEARNNLGETYLKLGRVEDAEAELRKAVALLDEYPLAHSNLAEVLFRKKDYEGAFAEAEKAMALNPDMPDPYNILGNLHRQQGKNETAVQDYRRALALDPNYEKAYYNLGIGCLDLNKYEEAKSFFLKALEINAAFAEAHAGLGACLLRENDNDAAIAEIQTAQKLGYRQAKANINLSAAFLRQGRIAPAVDEARKAVALEPGLAMAHNNLGVALSQQGAAEEATRQFRLALELDPKSKDAYVNLGNLDLQAGRFDEALELYARAVLIDPHDGMVHNNMAVIYFRKEQYIPAKECADKALAEGFKVNPDFLAELKKRIKR